MGRTYRRRLEVEILEDRCTPAGLFSGSEQGLLDALGFAGNANLSAGLASTITAAAEFVGPAGDLTRPPLFNLLAPAPGENLTEFPTPAVSLLPNDALLSHTGAGMFFLEGGSSLLDVNGLAEPINSSPTVPASGTDPGALLTGSALSETDAAGVPSTVPFPLPSYYFAMPLYDPSASVPTNVEFESLSPFTFDGMGRCSYEGSDGAGRYVNHPLPIPPASPPPGAFDSLDDLRLETWQGGIG